MHKSYEKNTAASCIELISNRVEDSWIRILTQIKGIFGPDFKVADEQLAKNDLFLCLLAWELLYIKRSYKEDQATRLISYVEEIITARDLGAYTLSELKSYYNLYSKSLSENELPYDQFTNQFLYRIIRDERKFKAYKISSLDLRKTWSAINPLTGVIKQIDEAYTSKPYEPKQVDPPMLSNETKEILQKNWKVPLIIFCLLTIVFGFRWQIDKTTSNGTITKYKTDRWNGTVYRETLGSSHSEKIIQYNKANFPTSEALTYIWLGATAGSIAWILYVASRNTKKSQQHSKSLSK